MPKRERCRDFSAIIFWLNRSTALLLCAMLVLSPWFFGTTQSWSITVMNAGGYALGFLCCAQRLTWKLDAPRSRRLAIILSGSLMLLLLAFVWVSAWNASATYVVKEARLVEKNCVAWLPHSFDAPATWKAFWKYLALVCVFWATHNWLASRGEEGERGRLSARVRLLLWLLSINGALLAIEGIIQRASGTANLLWIQPTHDNKEALAQFGPYAYRSNAAQYLNLIWPATLGFWWALHREVTAQRARNRGRHLLLPCVIAMAAGAVFSLSRAGAGVAGLLLVASCFAIAIRKGAPWQTRAAVGAIAMVTAAAAWFASGRGLARRFTDTASDPLAGRKETYELAEQMARDYPWWGTGPGTFNNLFQIYRNNPEQYWPAQLHNDWLEFRITFGRVGFTLMLAVLVITSLRWLVPGGVPRDRTFLLLTTFALGGCLLHASVDFPFQIYSIELLFVVLAAVLFSSSQESRRSSAP